MSERARFEAVARGRVQGVGYRAFVHEAATRLGLAGWVRNEPDGSVSCAAEGSRDQLEALVAELRQGPWSARVDAVEIAWTTPTGDDPVFRVRFGGDVRD